MANCMNCRFRIDSEGYMSNDIDPWPIYHCKKQNNKRLYDSDIDSVKLVGCKLFGFEGYLTWDEVEQKYGKEVADEMSKSQYLNGITLIVGINGVTEIPERDIDLAYRDVKKMYIHPEEWD